MFDPHKPRTPHVGRSTRKFEPFVDDDQTLRAKLASIDMGQPGPRQLQSDAASSGTGTLQEKLQSANVAPQAHEPSANAPTAFGSAGQFVSLADVAEKMRQLASDGQDAQQRAAHALEAIQRDGVKLRDEKSAPQGDVTHNPAVH